MNNTIKFTASQPINWGVDATLDITEYEHGYLFATAIQFHETLLKDGELDDKFCSVDIDGKEFIINIWYDKNADKTHGTVYAYDSDTRQIDTSLYGRLW